MRFSHVSLGMTDGVPGKGPNIPHKSRLCPREDWRMWLEGEQSTSDRALYYIFRDCISSNIPTHHTRAISIFFSRLHQFQIPIFMRHLPVPTLLKVLYYDSRLLAVSALTLLPLLHGFLNRIHRLFKNKECVVLERFVDCMPEKGVVEGIEPIGRRRNPRQQSLPC